MDELKAAEKVLMNGLTYGEMRVANLNTLYYVHEMGGQASGGDASPSPTQSSLSPLTVGAPPAAAPVEPSLPQNSNRNHDLDVLEARPGRPTEAPTTTAATSHGDNDDSSAEEGDKTSLATNSNNNSTMDSSASPAAVTTTAAARPIVVLVHGFGGGAAMWAKNWNTFTNLADVFAFDLPGFAASQRGAKHFHGNMEQALHFFMSSFEAWFEAMNFPERVIVVAHSFGGFLSSMFTARTSPSFEEEEGVGAASKKKDVDEGTTEEKEEDHGKHPNPKKSKDVATNHHEPTAETKKSRRGDHPLMDEEKKDSDGEEQDEELLEAQALAFAADSRMHRYIKHLILVDPWGIEPVPRSAQKEEYKQLSTRDFVITKLFYRIGPLGGLRAAGPAGPALIPTIRPDLGHGWESEERKKDFFHYLYHCNAQRPATGEIGFQSFCRFNAQPKIFFTESLVRHLPSTTGLTVMFGEISPFDATAAARLVERLQQRYQPNRSGGRGGEGGGEEDSTSMMSATSSSNEQPTNNATTSSTHDAKAAKKSSSEKKKKSKKDTKDSKGLGDEVLPMKMASSWAAHQNVEGLVIPDAGHQIFTENTEVFNEVMIRVIKEAAKKR